ncbi:MAG: formate dehydrogenase subunit gamma [Hyphomicrobiaceae bacterium]
MPLERKPTLVSVSMQGGPPAPRARSRCGPRGARTAPDRLRTVVALLVLTLAVLGTAGLLAAQAQSSVRPPDGAAAPPPSAQDTITKPGTAQGPAQGSDLWRKIREGKSGYSATKGPQADTLITSGGVAWRDLHNATVLRYGGWLLLGVVAVVALYFLVRGRIRISGGRSGRFIPRFTLVQRVVHWFMAVLFVLLAVSGLILMFGKHVLLPVLGPYAFAVVASASMQGHNLFGPLFVASTLALLVTFVKGNGYRWVDVKWLFKGGGFFGGHASSHKYNFGEKTWFWWSVVLGLALCVSGFALLFPNMLPDRAAAQLANLVHAGAAILFIAFAIGHIYLGTIGMEGALEGMTNGTVDENWARDHHDLWWQEHKGQATTDRRRAEVLAAERGDAVAGRAGS